MSADDHIEDAAFQPRLIQTGPSDTQLAEQYRQEMRAALHFVCAIMTKANRDKIEILFQLGNDAFGQQNIQMLKISKVL